MRESSNHKAKSLLLYWVKKKKKSNKFLTIWMMKTALKEVNCFQSSLWILPKITDPWFALWSLRKTVSTDQSVLRGASSWGCDAIHLAIHYCSFLTWAGLSTKYLCDLKQQGHAILWHDKIRLRCQETQASAIQSLHRQVQVVLLSYGPSAETQLTLSSSKDWCRAMTTQPAHLWQLTAIHGRGLAFTHQLSMPRFWKHSG